LNFVNFKLVGGDGTLNTEKKIRLQLFYSQENYRSSATDSLIPEVYKDCFKNPKRRVKYPASLHVTIKSILPPKPFTPGIRSLYNFDQASFGIGNNNTYFDQNQNILGNNGLADPSKSLNLPLLVLPPGGDSEENINSGDEYFIEKNNRWLKDKAVIWSRVSGLPCRIPNQVSIALHSGKQGCYSIKFSLSGSFLACACVDNPHSSTIYIFTIPDAKLIMKCHGHFGLVYEMSWSKGDKYLLTASNDATSRVFDISNRIGKEAFKILPHPTFVYSAKFYPDSTELCCTSGYDKVIRVWSIESVNTKTKYANLKQELFGHLGYVNSMCFSSNGNWLYSGDSAGQIICWSVGKNADSVIVRKSIDHQGKDEEEKVPLKEWTQHHDINVQEIKVTSIEVFFLN
jgi:jouberin